MRESLLLKQQKMKERMRMKEQKLGIFIPPIGRRSPEPRLKMAINYSKTVHVMACATDGGLDTFLSYLSASTANPMAVDFATKFRKAMAKNPHLTIDNYAKKLNILPTEVLAWASEGAYNDAQRAIRFVNSKNAARIAQANVESALNLRDGFKDRSLFMEVAGMKPRSSGTHIEVKQSNINEASAAVKSETSLPDFASSRRESAAIVRADD